MTRQTLHRAIAAAIARPSIAVCAIVIGLPFGSVQASDSQLERETSATSSIQPRLTRIIESGSPHFGEMRSALPDGRIAVCVQLADSQTPDLEAATERLLSFVRTRNEDHRSQEDTTATLASAGNAFGGRIGRSVEVWIYPDQVDSLLDCPEVQYLSLPHRPDVSPRQDSEWPEDNLAESPSSLPGDEIVTEALDDIRVPEFWSLGYQGEGVKVGVIDIGFASYLQRVGTELPSQTVARDFSGRGIEGLGDSHGTACAEIVHDLAPKAEFYLASIATATNLSEAVNWMIENDVDVINHSLAWFIGGGDGTGPIHDIVRRAADAGIVWVTSSGNYRQKHWMGPYLDANMNTFVEMTSAGTESIALRRISGSGRIALTLLWNQWPSSPDLSFQIDIYNGDELQSTSETDYADSPFAYREAYLPIGHGLDLPNVRIRLTAGTPSEDTVLRIFRTDRGGIDAKDRVTAGSLTMPADSPDAIAVGAYSWENQGFEPFSSHGPTLTGLVKPDVVGPDAISTSLAQYPTFSGTSASCPHVSGVVALLLSARIKGGIHDIRWSREEVVRMLEVAASPLASVSSDEQGAGRARLLVRRPDSSPLRLAQTDSEGLTFHFLESRIGLTSSNDSGPAPTELTILTASGRKIGTIQGTNDGSGTNFHISKTNVTWSRGLYFALEPLSRASVSFYWPG